MVTTTTGTFQFHCHTSEAMPELDDDSVALTVTAPPYWPAIDDDASIWRERMITLTT